MKLALLFFFFLIHPLLASPPIPPPDRSASRFEAHNRVRIDTYDFSGHWPNLENIDIDGKRKKRVEMDLSGVYPLLETVNYEGGFGLFNGKLTGEYPKLTNVNILCGSSKMHFDLRGKWQKSCEITIVGSNEDITLLLPANVGLAVSTKTGASGKVIVDGLEKKGYGIFKKRFENEALHEAEIVLTIHVVTADGRIHLNVRE